MVRTLSSFLLVLTVSSVASAAPESTDPLTGGRSAIHSLGGCYLVDYNYTETESLLAGYTRSSDVYEVNIGKSVKEWIYTEDVTPTHVRLQHILFMANDDGTVAEGTEMKHTGEDWEFGDTFAYDYVGPNTWNPTPVAPNQWTRKITNLDDGLRYECSGLWDFSKGYPSYRCSGFAPIPGRETRDMGRSDYQSLERSANVQAYGNSWIERQANTKVIDKNGVHTPLAKEVGKNWYVRLPDSDCRTAVAFAEPRKAFWHLLRDTWAGVLDGARPFVEKVTPGQSPRYLRLSEVEETYYTQNLNDPAVRQSATDLILKVIGQYRVNP